MCICVPQGVFLCKKNFTKAARYAFARCRVVQEGTVCLCGLQCYFMLVLLAESCNQVQKCVARGISWEDLL